MKRIILQFRAAVCLLILAIAPLLCGAPVAFAQNLPPAQYYASAYNQWSIPGQTANTYLFSPGGLCTATASGRQFFPFSTTGPVYIVDATPANSEVVTPSTVTNTGSQCGFTASPANNHYSFQVKSGTAGLQEGLNQLLSNNATWPALMVLDQNWYAAAASIPGQTANGIIGAATGSSSIILEDITTAPAKFYTWNGTKYASSLAAASFFNLKTTSNTVIAPPTALSTAAATYGIITTATTGGTIPASATYRLAITYVDASGGETLISTDSASTATIATGSGTATNTISITSPAALAGAVGYRLYMTAASGSAGAEILYAPTCTSTTQQYVLPGVCAIGFPATIKAIITGTATVPAVSTAYPRTSGSSFAYAPFTALGTVNAAATGTLGLINFPGGYLNTLGRSLQVCGNGYATTNSSAGTLTLAATLNSVANVTGITPFTVVSGATAASAQADPFNFCITFTTAATGATGTLEVHGCVNYSLSGTTVFTPACDTTIAVSSTVDLTKADQLSFTIKPTTTALTAAQLRQLTIVPIN